LSLSTDTKTANTHIITITTIIITNSASTAAAAAATILITVTESQRCCRETSYSQSKNPSWMSTLRQQYKQLNRCKLKKLSHAICNNYGADK